MASCCEPIVCTLSTPEAGDRLAEWSDLHDVATSVEQLNDGVRIHLPATFAAEARDLADRESKCCAFLDFEITELDDVIDMTIVSTDPDGVPVVHLLAGLTDQ